MNSESAAKRKCLGVDCENDAGTLQCPTCLKLGMKESFFCSQDCFKRSWVSSHQHCTHGAGQESLCMRCPSAGARSTERTVFYSRLTLFRANTRRYINHRVISSVASLPPKLSLNPIQTLAFTILSQPSPIPGLYDLSIRSQSDEKFPKR
jgi:hypothetical protein